MSDFKIGDTVEYEFYGKIKTNKIVRLSRDNSILFLADNTFLFAISVINKG